MSNRLLYFSNRLMYQLSDVVERIESFAINLGTQLMMQ